MIKHTAILILCCTSIAKADVQDVVEQDILVHFSAFAEQAAAFSDMSAMNCTAYTLRPAFGDLMQSWMQVQHWRIGPSQHLVHEIAFWPDPRGFVPSTLSSLITEQDQAAFDPAAFAEVSIAGRGLFALELMLFDPDFSNYGLGDYECQLVRAIASDLAANAVALSAGWSDYAETLLTAGDGENQVFQTKTEAEAAIFTQVLSGLEFTVDQRIARPLGTIDRPRPTRAEAWRSENSLPNIITSTQAMITSARFLYGQTTPTLDAAEASFLNATSAVELANLGEIETDSIAWFKLSVLQERVNNVATAIQNDIGTAMNLSAGFNAGDGD